jgi:geranylgeranyl diphosphate synthase type I
MNSSHTHFEDLANRMRPALQTELETVLALADSHHTPLLHQMLSYQMGWEGEKAGPDAQGKQIRPLLVLLSAKASGGTWQDALPAAAAVELIHNFSLIHDDIQDKSDLRRGRPTVWKQWGRAQAINTGDAMFTLGFRALLRLRDTCTADIALQAAQILQDTCLRLTQGQHLDIAFEDREKVTLEEYWEMVEGKTASLLAACPEIGALCAGSTPAVQTHYRAFGQALGLAFQAQDDLLGIWGETKKSGKSTTGDLITRKKTLPILYGLSREKEFSAWWEQKVLREADIPGLAALLKKEGAYTYTKNRVQTQTTRALAALQEAQPQGSAGKALHELAHKLVGRSA